MRVWAAVLFCLISVSDVLTLCPTIYWRDAPEFVDVVATLGIPHPAGSPTYVNLARAFYWLPFGTVTQRIHLASGFFHALAILVLFFVIVELARWCLPRVTPWCIAAAAFLISLAFGLSPAFWLAAGTAEVYTMNAAFFMFLVWMALRALQHQDLRALYLGAFLYGLASGVHATVVFYLPAFLYLYVKVAPRGRRAAAFSGLSLFFLLGFSIYLYLPIRSLANPTFDWGNPETLRQFLFHITDRKTKAMHFSSSLVTTYLVDLPRYWRNLTTEIGWLGVGLTPLGIYLHMRKPVAALRSLFVVFVFLALGNIGFFLNWKTGDGFIPSNLIFSVWSGLALAMLLGQLQKRSSKAAGIRWERIVVITLGLFIGYAAFFPFPLRATIPYEFANRSQFYNAYETARREIERTEPDAVLVSTLFWFPFRYLQDVERYREDLSIVMASDILAPQYFNPLTAERFPKLELPSENPLRTPWYRYMPELINLNIRSKAIYYEPHNELVRPIFRNLLPGSFLFRIEEGDGKRGLSPSEIDQFMDNIHAMLAAEVEDGAFEGDANSREYYMTFLVFISEYLIYHGHDLQANSLLRAAADLRPNQGTVELYLGQTEIALGDRFRGMNRLTRLLSTHPTFAEPYHVLGRQYLLTGDLAQASWALGRAKALSDKLDLRLYFSLVELHWRQGDLAKAQQALQEALSKGHFAEDFDDIQFWKDILEDAKLPTAAARPGRPVPL